jgi:protein tyrosine phosphatase
MTTNNFLSSKKIQATIDAHIHHLEKETGEKKKIDYKKNDVANILFKDTSYQAFGINCCARYDDEKNNINDILSSQYLLAPCPKDLYQVGDLFQLALSGSDDNNINCKSKLMVSVFTRGEKEKVKYVDNYWEEEVLKNIPLRYGWYYLYSTEEKKQEKEKEKEKVVASLTERKIIFQNARDGRRKEITHLHLNGWLDQTQCEDEDLLIQLVERIETLTAPTVSIDDENSKHQARSENKESNRSTQTLTSPKRAQPFILGCIHSRSRSATVLLIHLVRQEIRKKLSNYCSHSSPSSQLPVLEDISINIPEIIFKLRQQRLEFMRRPCQMVNLYSVTNYFCRQLFEARNYLREVFSETELSENKFSETKETKETRKKDEEKIVSNILSFL